MSSPNPKRKTKRQEIRGLQDPDCRAPDTVRFQTSIPGYLTQTQDASLKESPALCHRLLGSSISRAQAGATIELYNSVLMDLPMLCLDSHSGAFFLGVSISSQILAEVWGSGDSQSDW